MAGRGEERVRQREVADVVHQRRDERRELLRVRERGPEHASAAVDEVEDGLPRRLHSYSDSDSYRLPLQFF